MTARFLLPLAILASTGVHFALAGISTPSEELVPTGGDVAGEVALGTSFADLVQGVNSGVDTPPERTEPHKPTKAEQVAAAPPAKVEMTASSEHQPVAATAKPVSPLAAHSDVTAPVKQVTATKPEVVKATPNAEPPKVVKAQPEVAKKPHQVQKIVARPDPVKAQDKPVKPAVPKSRGNAKVNAATGQDNGKKTATAAESTTAKETKAKQAGGKAMKRYQSAVLRRVARTRGASAGAKGASLVVMSIGGNGGLSAVRLSKSSGNPRVDQVALQIVERAAPFGPPPQGQPVRFTIRVNVKG